MSLLATPTNPRDLTDLTDLTADHGDHCEAQFPAVGGRDIHLRGVTISYHRAGQTVTPISNLDLYASANRVTALVGRSGSGKTSLLSCMAAMLKPQSGAIWLGGIEVTALRKAALDDYRRNHVGVIHQHYNLLPSLTAIENVAVPLRLTGLGRRESTERADSLLQELGLGHYLSHRPGQLSGGQQQRVAVARALATNPSLVLADEPTAHLDGSSVDDVSALLRSIAASGRTVIVATHDDRLLPMVDQQIHL